MNQSDLALLCEKQNKLFVMEQKPFYLLERIMQYPNRRFVLTITTNRYERSFF